MKFSTGRAFICDKTRNSHQKQIENIAGVIEKRIFSNSRALQMSHIFVLNVLVKNYVTVMTVFGRIPEIVAQIGRFQGQSGACPWFIPLLLIIRWNSLHIFIDMKARLVM